MDPSPVVAGLLRSVFSGFWPILLVLVGIAGVGVAVTALVQTRRWPKQTAGAAAVVTKPKPTAPAAPVAPEPAVVRPAQTARFLQIRLPGVRAEHPDVWEPEVPLEVLVEVDRTKAPKATGHRIRLSRHTGDQVVALNEAEPVDGVARFSVRFAHLGEHDLVAELVADGRPVGQAVRAVRIVEYRAEIVETFEDFVAWAAGQFEFVDPKFTAREFVDRFADGRAGTPIAPLETIADLYELANYSDHPVDRHTYLRMVDAFLELERSGALDGPEAH